ncbi:MAG: glycerol-3-phosphate dehydrogenase/oxidase [Gammaproteobacteria bacterium]|nr:glycerol-3-phosphate dehydrogenase/oxidase [Gammaproteobacteria bacterium]
MKQYDVVIIGGGIHGAGCAQAAAAQGYSCLLLEQYTQPAQGTSSRSSKLIHGGLRYLETGQFSLVKECLRERRRLLKNAPDLVKLIPFYIPVYKHSKRPPWMIRLGLMLYFLFGGGYFKSIAKNEWSQLDSIRTDNLVAVYRYWDAQTDDAALTRAVLESASSLNADIIMSAHFEKAQRNEDGYHVTYSRNEKSLECQARCLINAAGPWINQLLEKITPEPAVLAIDLIAGTHLVLPGHLGKGIYYLESPSDGRAVFAAPWKNNILIGTTETVFNGTPDSISPTQEEINYLLSIYNHYFDKNLKTSDVVSSFAGCRVLPASDNSAFHRSRETIILADNKNDPHLLSIYGGKLTAYRATAETVMNHIRLILGKKEIKADTKHLKINI